MNCVVRSGVSQGLDALSIASLGLSRLDLEQYVAYLLVSSSKEVVTPPLSCVLPCPLALHKLQREYFIVRCLSMQLLRREESTFALLSAFVFDLRKGIAFAERLTLNGLYVKAI